MRLRVPGAWCLVPGAGALPPDPRGSGFAAEGTALLRAQRATRNQGPGTRNLQTTTLVFLLISMLGASEGLVQFSDGSDLHGAVSLAPGASLKLHDGEHRHLIAAETVAEIRLEPEQERLVRQWRFLEPGKPAKEEVGEPMPLRELRARLLLRDGSSLDGHLFTTMCLLRNDEGRHKVLLPAQQKGEPGSSLESLVYPQRLVLAAVDRPATTATLVLPADCSEVVVCTRPGLARFALDPAAPQLPPLGGRAVFLALRDVDGIRLASPGHDPALGTRLQSELRAVNDFFDHRAVVLAWREHGLIYSVIELQRRGVSTGPKPWRVELWRWRHDEVSDRLLTAGRGWLMRGTGEAPALVLDPELWHDNPACHPEDAP